MKFEDVFVPDHNKIANATDFERGTSKILEASRLGVGWLAAGVSAGVYEETLKYALSRH